MELDSDVVECSVGPRDEVLRRGRSNGVEVVLELARHLISLHQREAEIGCVRSAAFVNGLLAQRHTPPFCSF